MSLRARVLAGSAIIAVLLAVAAVFVTRATERHLVEQVDAQLAGAARTAQDPRGRDPRGPRPGPGGEDGPALPRPLSSAFLGYVLEDGTISVESVAVVGGEALPAPSCSRDEAVASARGRQPITVGADGSGVRYRVLATFDRGGNLALVGLPLVAVDDAVARLVAIEVAVTVAILGVLALVAWWVLHLGVRPIKRMTVAASAIAAGELSHRVPEADPRTEAGALGVALNHMLGRIEGAFRERARSEDRLRQFVADASHELRTPITTIRGYADLYRAGGLAKKQDLTEAMRRTEQEAIRMGSLVEDLLLLARLDQGRPLEREDVDLVAIAEDAARDARAVDPERPIATAAVDPPVRVTGDEGRLRQVVANVVGNALVHTPPATPIELRVFAEDGVAVVEIADRGAGMPAEVASRAFERFYRADPSRSRHRGGTGLGLAIVQSTVEAHGGTVRLLSAEGAGTTVRIELPMDPSSPAHLPPS